MGPRPVTNAILAAGALGAFAFPAAPATAAPPAWRPFTVFPEPAQLITAAALDDGTVSWWAATGRPRLDTAIVRLRSSRGTLGPVRSAGRWRSVSIDPASGRAIMSEVRPSLGTDFLWLSRLARDGSPIGRPLRISTPGTRIGGVAAGADATGGGAVMWTAQRPGGAAVLQARRILPTGGAGPVQVIARTRAAPTLAMAPSGLMVAIWREDLPNRQRTAWRIRTAVAAPGRQLGAAATLAAGNGGVREVLPQQLTLVLGRDGSSVATWISGGSCMIDCVGEFVGADLYAATGGPGRRPAGAQRLFAGGLTGDIDPVSAAAVGPSGEALVAWRGRRKPLDAGSAVVMAAIAERGGRFEPAVVLDTNQLSGSPSAAFDSAGTATVAWPRYIEPRLPIAVATRPRGGRFTAPTVINHRTGAPYTLTVSGGGRRTTVISWTRVRRIPTHPEDVEAAIRRG